MATPTSSRRRFLLGLGLAPALLVVGDSISAAYGLPPTKGWVSLLKARLATEQYPHRVINASISGDTTAGGNARMSTLLKEYKPAIVVIELGGNDALRGLPLKQTEANLAAMTRAAKAAGARVVVVGMQVPPNYGRQYVNDFAAVFANVAKSEGVALVPFLLKGVDDVEAMFQADRIHPKETAHPVMLGNVWPVLRPLLPR